MFGATVCHKAVICQLLDLSKKSGRKPHSLHKIPKHITEIDDQESNFMRSLTFKTLGLFPDTSPSVACLK